MSQTFLLWIRQRKKLEEILKPLEKKVNINFQKNILADPQANLFGNTQILCKFQS